MKYIFLTLVMLLFFAEFIRAQEEEVNYEEEMAYRDTGYVLSAYLVSFFSFPQKISSSFGDYKNNDILVGVHVINGYHIWKDAIIGFGVGLEKAKNGGFIPLYISCKVSYLTGKSTPFLLANLGYSLGWVNGQTGMNWGGGTLMWLGGFNTYLNKDSAIRFALGYRRQEILIRSESWTSDEPYLEIDRPWAHYLSLLIGFTF